MKAVRRQLVAFHTNGNICDDASVEHDYALALHYAATLNEGVDLSKQAEPDSTDLSAAFEWRRTKEGHQYWAERCVSGVAVKS